MTGAHHFRFLPALLAVLLTAAPAPAQQAPGPSESPQLDVNADGVLDADDGLVLYYGYALRSLVGDGSAVTGVARFRSTLLGGRAGSADPIDADLRAMLTEADRWSRYGLAVGGDLNSDGAIDSDDALVLYYSRAIGTLLGDGSEESGSERFRSNLLGSRDRIRRSSMPTTWNSATAPRGWLVAPGRGMARGSWR